MEGNMEIVNEAYKQKFPASTTIVVGNSIEFKDVEKYLLLFNKKAEYFFIEENILEKKETDVDVLTEEALLSISKTSIFILTNREVDVSLLKELGYTEIYVYHNNAIEKLCYLDISISENIFKYTYRVTFELSNLCNYADIHKKCPLNLETKQHILSTKIVYETIDCLSEFDFKGYVAFHRYNEPLIDSRLLDFIGYARKKCPQTDIYILTNGYNLTQKFLDTLVSFGVTLLEVTAYTVEEFERLSLLETNIPFRIVTSRFDNRLTIYEYVNQDNSLIPCFCPLNDLIITRNGDLGLCHFDWKSQYSFGNLENQSLKELIINSDILNTFNDLSKGIRKYELCKNCKSATRSSNLSFSFSNIFFDPVINT